MTKTDKMVLKGIYAIVMTRDEPVTYTDTFFYCLNFLKIQSLYLFLAIIKKSIRGIIPADSLPDAVKKIFRKIK